jgi:hypothetical protein
VLERNLDVHQLLIHVNHQNVLIDVVYAILRADFETKSNAEINLLEKIFSKNKIKLESFYREVELEELNVDEEINQDNVLFDQKHVLIDEFVQDQIHYVFFVFSSFLSACYSRRPS